MYEWKKQIQIIVDEIDQCIKGYNDEALTLRFLSRRLGYSEFYTSRKFKEISGIQELSAAQEAGLCLKRGQGQPEESSGYCL